MPAAVAGVAVIAVVATVRNNQRAATVILLYRGQLRFDYFSNVDSFCQKSLRL